MDRKKLFVKAALACRIAFLLPLFSFLIYSQYQQSSSPHGKKYAVVGIVSVVGLLGIAASSLGIFSRPWNIPVFLIGSALYIASGLTFWEYYRMRKGGKICF
ncbi:MAG: hypothetical protein V1684_02640 [bacterium]